RRRGAVAAAAGAVAVVGALIAFYTMRLSRERDRAAVQAEKASKVSELLTGLLTGADPYRTPDAKEPTVRNLLDAGAEHVARDLGDRPELQAEMVTVIGRTYHRTGRNAKTRPLREVALALRHRPLGPEHQRGPHRV